MRIMKTSSTVAAAALLSVIAASDVSAQLPNASARALGMGDNYVAGARGYNAVAWNPAGLGMPRNPRFSLALLPVRGVGGLDPITTSDLAEWQDKVVPAEVRRGWLDEIRTEGSQQGNGGGDLSLGLSIGRLAIQAGAMARGSMNIAPDAAELLLFGNAGLTGEPHDFSAEGSSMQAFATAGAAVSYGHPIRLRNPKNSASVGVTVKYTRGVFLMHGEDRGSTLQDDPLTGSVDFPILETNDEDAGNAGSGIGLDLGFGWTNSRTTIGVAVQNVFNSFEWDESSFGWRPGSAYFDQDSTATDFDKLDSAPAELLGYLEDQRFRPTVAVGAEYAPFAKLTLSGDFRKRLGEGMDVGPAMHLGAGAEYRIIPFLPLRAGAAKITGGYELSAGAGLQLIGININGGVARRDTDLGTDAIGMLTLSFGSR